MTRSSFDRLAHLRKRAHSLRSGLLSRLGEYASDFPSGTPRETIDLIKKILKAAEDQINISTDARFLEQACRTIQTLGSLLSFFDNAHTAQTPRGLAEMVGLLMVELQPDSQLMVWPQAEFNYSIGNILPPLKSATEHFLPPNVHKEIFDPFKGALNLVSFPRVERDNVLLHAILGHELGHPIAEKFLESEKGTKKYNDGLNRAVEKLTGPRGDNGGEAEAALDTLAPVLTRLLALRTRGLQELISDCVGVLLFGLSAIFAAYDVLTVSQLDALPDNTTRYPPSRFRLRLQRGIADRIGHLNATRSLGKKGVDRALMVSVNDFLDHLDSLIGETHDLDALKKDRVIEIAYEWIGATIEDAVTFAMEELGKLTFEVTKVEREVPELINRIDLGLPPNETGLFPHTAPADWRSSILAAWLYRLHGKKLAGDLKGTPLEATELEKLNRLTLKAIEYTILQNRYSAHMTKR